MISSTISFLLATLVLNSVSTSFAAPVRFTQRNSVDALTPRVHTLGAVDDKILRRIIQKDAGINEPHSSRGQITIVSSVTTVVKDSAQPGSVNLISTTTVNIGKVENKPSCSGHPASKKGCGKKAGWKGWVKPGKKCGKKTEPAIPSGGTNSTTTLPGPLNSSNTTTTPGTPLPDNLNSTSTPPSIQRVPILVENPNSTTTPPDIPANPQPVRRRDDGDVKPRGSNPSKPREVKQRLDKRNRMSFS